MYGAPIGTHVRRLSDTLLPVNSDAFLGAVATAAAALVAIVGGLLVARVISLATERAGVSQRIDDLRAALTIATSRHGELDARLLEVDLSDVEYDVIDDIIAGRSIDAAKVRDRLVPERTYEQVAGRIYEVATRVEAIREALASAWASGFIDQTREEYTDAEGIVVAEGDEFIWDEIWDLLARANPKPRGRGFYGAFAQMPYIEPPSIAHDRAIENAIESTEVAALRRDVDGARHQITTLESEVAHAELALSRVMAPRGVFSGLWVLVSVVLSGVILPLSLMAGGVSLSMTQRFLVLAAFALGLTALAAYLAVETRRLTTGTRSSN